MIPAVSNPVPVPPQPSPVAAQKVATPQAPETARTSAGEASAANVRAETARAIDAPAQTPVPPRLRDQENAQVAAKNFQEHTGPEPTFKESPLERQARVALDPPDIADDLPASEPKIGPAEDSIRADSAEAEPQLSEASEPPAFKDPPPTPSERAEVSFAETRSFSAAPEPATVDVAR